jgi:hypothetical protein
MSDIFKAVSSIEKIDDNSINIVHISVDMADALISNSNILGIELQKFNTTGYVGTLTFDERHSPLHFIIDYSQKEDIISIYRGRIHNMLLHGNIKQDTVVDGDIIQLVGYLEHFNDNFEGSKLLVVTNKGEIIKECELTNRDLISEISHGKYDGYHLLRANEIKIVKKYSRIELIDAIDVLCKYHSVDSQHNNIWVIDFT